MPSKLDDHGLGQFFQDYETQGSIELPPSPDGTKAVFLSDLQIPMHDEKLLETIVDDFLPDFLRGATEKHVFLVGDVADLMSLSAFENYFTQKFTLDDEFNLTMQWLRRIGKKFTHKHYAMGNHEARYERSVWSTAPRLAPFVRPLDEALHLAEIGYDWVPYRKHYLFNGFVVTHGTRTGKHPASLELMDYQRSGVSGHVNRPQSHTSSSAAKHDPATWHCLGMLCRTDIGDIIKDWRKIQPWQQGFGIGEVQDGILHFESVRVHHGAFRAANRIYQVRT